MSYTIQFTTHTLTKFTMESYRAWSLLAIMVLSLCLGMQVLGTTMTLWDLAFVPDNARDALSEGFSLPQPLFVVALIARLPRYRVTIGMASDPLRETLLSDSLFRPPIAS
jgi:hypothetical protein